MAKLLIVGHEPKMALVDNKTFTGVVVGKGLRGSLELQLVSSGDVSETIELSPTGVVVRLKKEFIRMVIEALEESLEGGAWEDH